MQYVTEIFDRVGKLDKLKGFATEFGRRFYMVPLDRREGKIIMVRRGMSVRETFGGQGGDAIVPFRAGGKLGWDVIWLEG